MDRSRTSANCSTSKSGGSLALTNLEKSKQRLDEIYDARRQLGTNKGFVMEWLNKCPSKAVEAPPKETTAPGKDSMIPVLKKPPSERQA